MKNLKTLPFYNKLKAAYENLKRETHIPTQVLECLIHDELSEEGRKTIEAHLAYCEQCKLNLQQLKRAQEMIDGVVEIGSKEKEASKKMVEKVLRNIPALLEISNIPNARSFQADEGGIIELKAEFVAEASRFLYLRKGEDVGADVISVFYSLCRNVDWPTILSDFDWNNLTETRVNATALIPTISSLILRVELLPWFQKKRKKRSKQIKDFHIICTKNETTLKAYPINSSLGVNVRFYTKQKAHLHRYYVSDKRYAFFVRHGKHFFGHIGDDPKMIDALKSSFEDEWESLPSEKAN